jgi:SEC-C motif-containing protein
MASVPRDCPCFSGHRYGGCCAPYHRGEREAASPEALMRSRYAAYALGLGAYLAATLASDHPDLELPREAMIRELSRAREGQRFMGLRILHASTGGDRGEVLFFARIFERGADRSFVELSSFVREGGAWRYAEGAMVPAPALDVPLDVLTPDDVRRVAALSRA